MLTPPCHVTTQQLEAFGATRRAQSTEDCARLPHAPGCNVGATRKRLRLALRQLAHRLVGEATQGEPRDIQTAGGACKPEDRT